MNIRFLLGVIFCAAVATSGLAQDTASNAPATKEDILRYFDAVHSHDMVIQMFDAMSKPIHQMVHEQYLQDKDKLPADFEERTDKVIDDMVKNMPYDAMIQATIPVYQKHFTKADIDSLIAFYASPTGQKVLREMPGITAEAMQSMIPIMQKHMEAIRQRVQEQVADALRDSTKKTN